MPPKTILITGCGPHGIGSALATEFHTRGHRVFATGLSESLLTPLQAIGIETLTLDVTSASSISRAASHVSKLTEGKLDILINNAGIIHILPFADTCLTDAHNLFDVNVFGTIAVTHAFLPLLRSAAQTHGDALIANIVSINSTLRPPFFSLYNASKAAVEVLSASIRPELAPFGIRVVTVKTGSVETDLFANAPVVRLPPGSWYEAARAFIEGKGMLGFARSERVEVYARGVVDELVRPRGRKVLWRGGLTGVAWVLGWFGWEGMMVSLRFS
ncbi:putative short-chain dehydrogenase/reductase [Annulohypoxylon maeteangense]|uniref:putative short-chain dehydrogenase/reductase n=1 Tax=Annulohypoxylon maeteangense TaxID=1927788 RepID=UPI0020084073|nr:putative short-chain dehydrogenase/reductase [Annulohypoxylon maeteangense]KAI0880499.1 putative short-chain dehydrogenase/reductase [Annulohypoxylon maeteangense]